MQNAESGIVKVKAGKTEVSEVKSATKLSWEEQKKAEAERRKAEKAVSALEEQISKLEDEKTAEENKMANPEVYSNGEKAKVVQKRINELASQLEELNLQWMEAAEQLEALKG